MVVLLIGGPMEYTQALAECPQKVVLSSEHCHRNLSWVPPVSAYWLLHSLSLWGVKPTEPPDHGLEPSKL